MRGLFDPAPASRLGGLAPTTYDVPALWTRLQTALQVGWARVYATWARVEPSPGTYDFSYLENRLGRLFAGGTGAAVITIDQERPSHADREGFAVAYGKMAGALGSWLAGRGWLGRTALQVGNELYYTGRQTQWLPSGVVDTPSFAAFMLALHQEVDRQARQRYGLRVIGRSLSLTWSGNEPVFAAGGAASLIDAITLHDYSTGYDRPGTDPRLADGNAPPHADRMLRLQELWGGLPIVCTEFGMRGDSVGQHLDWLVHWYRWFREAGGILVAPQTVVDGGGETGLGGFATAPAGVSWEVYHEPLPKTVLLRELCVPERAAVTPAPDVGELLECRAMDYSAQLDRIEQKLTPAPAALPAGPTVAEVDAISYVDKRAAERIVAWGQGRFWG